MSAGIAGPDPALVIGDVPEWGAPYLAELTSTLQSVSDPFPCTFAVAAARKRTLRFAFVDDLGDDAAWAGLATSLRQYLQIYQEFSRDTSFVALFRPERTQRELAGYRERFWSVLQYLHDHDDEPWPAEIPTDPEDPHWEFCFGGTPIFVVCNTPAYSARRSRFGRNFQITFQPRWVFDELGPDSPRGIAARRSIRRRLLAYDRMPPSGFLGDYGDPANREYRQYFLPDREDVVAADGSPPQAAGCPFAARAAATAGGREQSWST
ncbi:YqcI/YcgG family protein [Pseudonocardia sp. GCM10023141]|uniref:YqcI/YcgG family protein n=1 Tax=Pseudonocardia sp. GCM10023141 TaxID=3252653 RepID=UPI00360C9D55